MCNACGFGCCASDMFSGCGCDHCNNALCWGICPLCDEYDEECTCYDDDGDYEGLDEEDAP